MNEPSASDGQIVIIGGGPAGLTAAYELTKHDVRPVVIEKRDIVGGLARTEAYKGFHFDMGGHRFFTKTVEVRKMWHEVLGHNFLRRPRLSRIYYKKKFFYYPLRPLNALKGLGLLESCRILFSCLWWQLFPHRQEDTFEQWVTNRFGKRLFQIFFKSYTEKVWGIPCSELKAEWAAQRIKGLSLKTALLNMFFKPKTTIKSLIEEFEYPRLGPGMMWNTVKEHIEGRGATVRLEADVAVIARNGNRIENITIATNSHMETIPGKHFISSMPVSDFIKKLDPPAPAAVLRAAENIHYRDFLTVCLIIKERNLFPDNWIYIHDPEVKVGRIQNFKNWSPEMVPDPDKTSLGLEYFCTEGSELWNMADADLIELAKQEVARIGLAGYGAIEDGCVCRVPKAYPIYDSDYRDSLVTVRKFVDGLANFQTIGRNGLHRYNNQDHAMLTGMLAARNLMLGELNDLWNVNTDQEYHEEMPVESEVPEPAIADVLQGVLSEAFPKLDRVALGLSMGAVGGMALFLATLFLVMKGGDVIGPNLQLLNQYFPGYSVTMLGASLGLGYGFGGGFASGWSFAFFRNASLFLYVAVTRRRAERQILRKLLEYF